MNQPLATTKNSAPLLFVIAGALLFNAVFWQEKLVLNMVLFTVFSTGALLFLYKGIWQHRNTRKC